MRKTLPPGQANMIKYLAEYFIEHGYYPSSRETQEFFGFNSQTGVLTCWSALTRKGIIKRPPHKVARAYVLVWKEVIERTREIWNQIYLKPYFIEIFDGGQWLNQTFWLPSWQIINLYLMETKMVPKEIKISLIEE